MNRSRLVDRLGLVPLAVIVAATGLFVSHAPPSSANPAIHISQNHWDVYVKLTASDGMRVYDATYMGKTVWNSGVTIPQIQVNYPDGLILHDQLLPVLNSGGIDKSNVTDGFKVTARYCFGPCGNPDYDYLQIYYFHSDGEFDPWLRVSGPGLSGHGGTPNYRIWWRMDFDIKGSTGDYIDRYNAGAWQEPGSEGDWADDGNHSPNDYEWRNRDPSEAFNVLPFPADSARFFGLRFHSGEGDTDLSQVTSPGSLENGEQIQNVDNVDWYRADTDNGCTPTSPCLPGPFLFANNF